MAQLPRQTSGMEDETPTENVLLSQTKFSTRWIPPIKSHKICFKESRHTCYLNTIPFLLLTY